MRRAFAREHVEHAVHERGRGIGRETPGDLDGFVDDDFGGRLFPEQLEARAVERRSDGDQVPEGMAGNIGLARVISDGLHKRAIKGVMHEHRKAGSEKGGS